jgi:hemerythrin-like domain-containing protein
MHAPTDGLVHFFTADHRHCDELWAAVEAAADKGHEAARAAFDDFYATTRMHLDLEEQVLFPAFEQATGMTEGPTTVMRMEHEQMRALLEQVATAISTGDLEEALDQGDTLLMLTQQHDQKEEAMLYPMAEQALGGQWEELAGRLEQHRSA